MRIVRFWRSTYEVLTCFGSGDPITKFFSEAEKAALAQKLAVAEGDIVALLNVGSYCQAAGGRHCLRPVAPAVYFGDRSTT